jgi:signal recognition particle subunit SRP68
LLLSGELHRHRALVELHNITASQDAQESSLPLIERLSTYPLQGVNLKNIVTYPPKLEPIPVKPLFFDVAWNYIEYPGQTTTIKTAVAGGKTEQPQVDSKPDPPAVQKKGWFGFGGR